MLSEKSLLDSCDALSFDRSHGKQIPVGFFSHPFQERAEHSGIVGAVLVASLQLFIEGCCEQAPSLGNPFNDLHIHRPSVCNAIKLAAARGRHAAQDTCCNRKQSTLLLEPENPVRKPWSLNRIRCNCLAG